MQKEMIKTANHKMLPRTVIRLIEEGDAVLATSKQSQRDRDIVDSKMFAKWLAGCRGLMQLLGNYAPAWDECFEQSAEFYYIQRAETMHSTLQAIQESVEEGLLIQLEDIVSAEIFNSLLEQAEYLLSEGYFLPAGVLGRAVLEEHLRNWCDHAECSPGNKRPTLNDYNMKLYTEKHYNTSIMKHVDSMAAVGNDAAHNNEELEKTDVERLLRDVREFLAKHSFA